MPIAGPANVVNVGVRVKTFVITDSVIGSNLVLLRTRPLLLVLIIEKRMRNLSLFLLPYGPFTKAVSILV